MGLAALIALLRFGCKSQRGVTIDQTEAIGVAVQALDLVEHGTGYLHRRQTLVTIMLEQFNSGHLEDVLGHGFLLSCY